jgi:hypothetical protein
LLRESDDLQVILGSPTRKIADCPHTAMKNWTMYREAVSAKKRGGRKRN